MDKIALTNDCHIHLAGVPVADAPGRPEEAR
jgi:hypothetical protein